MSAWYTDEDVERAAEAIYDAFPSQDTSLSAESGWVTHSWAEMPERYKGIKRQQARAALSAVRPVATESLEIIAAAEDLLDGLWTRHDYPFKGQTIVRDGTAERLRDAIAAAKGEQS